jgi:hypothetical protein
VWCPDPDIEFTFKPETLFKEAKDAEVIISQPIVSVESKVSHNICKDPKNETFVECMAPVFTIGIFSWLLNLMHLSPSGYGLDYLWSGVIHKVKMLPNCMIDHMHPPSYSDKKINGIMTEPSNDMIRVMDFVHRANLSIREDVIQYIERRGGGNWDYRQREGKEVSNA